MPISKSASARIQVPCATRPDPRRRKLTHPLINFIVIAICGVICGADDFVAIADFGRKKRRWFRKILDLRSGDAVARPLQGDRHGHQEHRAWRQRVRQYMVQSPCLGR